jgi:hypothetical protein
MRWLYDLPLPILFALTLVVAVAFGLGGVYFARRRGLMLDAENAATSGFVHAFAGVVYAVALGLIVVGVQSGYEEMEGVAVAEASLASDLYRNLEAFPAPERAELQRLTRRYVNAVVEQEWPEVSRGGERSEPTWAVIDSIAFLVITTQPTTEQSRLVFPEAVRVVNQLLDRRRERLFLGTSGVGTVTWSVVLLGAVLVIGVAWFFNTPSARAHYALVGAMSAIFGLMIFLIVAMDHPMWGRFSVQPDAFRTVGQNIDRWERERPTAVIYPEPGRP